MEPTQKSNSMLIVVFVVSAILLLAGGAFILSSINRQNSATTPAATPANQTTPTTPGETDTPATPPAATEEFTTSQLATFDGKDGNKCYVAVSGTVYEISDSGLWINGVHTQAPGGEVRCGLDLTQQMLSAPHGTTKLNGPFMKQVGRLAS